MIIKSNQFKNFSIELTIEKIAPKIPNKTSVILKITMCLGKFRIPFA